MAKLHALLCLCSWILCFFAQLVPAPREGDIHLVRDGIVRRSLLPPHCGRVEIYHDGRWGTVCDNGWNKRDADVTCRQLGYENGAKLRCYEACFGRGEGEIWMENLKCPHDADRLSSCQFRGWGVHDCTHDEDAGVCCKEPLTLLLPPVQTGDTRVRISCPCAESRGESCNECLNLSVNELHPMIRGCDPVVSSVAVEGIVEVSFGDLWLPVSADGWDELAANVACGELGYPLALLPSRNASEIEAVCTGEKVRGEFSVSEAKCNGSETMLASCNLQTEQASSSFVAATVRCGYALPQNCTAPVHRLRAGAVPWKGRVEVKVGGVWGTISEDQFGMEEARVVCRDLGYGSPASIQTGAAYGRGIGPVHYQDLQCMGNESSLIECPSLPGNVEVHSTDVGVECRRPRPCPSSGSSQLRMASPTTNGSRVSGYPELNGPDGPGFLCAGILDKPAARVVCRQTTEQFLWKMSAVNRTMQLVGGGVYYSGEVVCNGSEVEISECSLSLQPVAQCPVLHLTCTSCLPDLVPDIDMFRHSLQMSRAIFSRQMSQLQCALEEDCLSSSAYSAGLRTSRTLLRFDSLTYNWGLCDFLPNLDREDWIYHDCHRHYHSFEAFVDYNLRHPDTGIKVAEGHKASFCLEDTECAGGSADRVYRCLVTDAQGISANCGDRYPRYLDCQWIDITGVEDGEYLVSQGLNPHRDSEESDFGNNDVTCRVHINGTSISVSNCWRSDH